MPRPQRRDALRGSRPRGGRFRAPSQSRGALPGPDGYVEPAFLSHVDLLARLRRFCGEVTEREDDALGVDPPEKRSGRLAFSPLCVVELEERRHRFWKPP